MRYSYVPLPVSDLASKRGSEKGAKFKTRDSNIGPQTLFYDQVHRVKVPRYLTPNFRVTSSPP
jgi:hypothetical protein